MNFLPSRSYLICHPPQFGVEEFIEETKISLKITPADTHFLDGKVLKIAEVREVLHQISFKAHSSPLISVFLKNAEFISREIGNTLLKTLEEPPPQVSFFLFCQNSRRLLPTILSRVEKIFVSPQEKQDFIYQYPLIKIKAMSLKKRFDLANQLVKNEMAEETIKEWIFEARENLPESKESLEVLFQTEKALQGTNASPRLLLENLLLNL